MKTNFFANDELPPYLFEAIHELKVAAKEKGVDIIDFGMGNPDLPPPDFAMEKLAQLAKNPKLYGYSVVGGAEELKKSFCQYYKRRFGVELDYQKESIVTIGAKEGLTSLATALSMGDDYVVVSNPSYPIHNFAFLIAKNKVKQINAIKPREYFDKFKDLVKNSAKKPLAIIVNYPCNPTSESVDLSFYQELVDFCKKEEIYIISDIAYCEIYFGEENKPHSILEIDGAKDVAIEFSSVSKSFSLAGSRVGFAAGNQNLIKALHKMKSYLDYGSFSPLQLMVCECLKDENQEKSDEYLLNLRQTYQSRAEILSKLLNEELNWKCEKAKAAMFIWLKIPEKFIHLGSFGFCKMLIEKTGVALSAGVGFGENGENYVRFSLIHDEGRMKEAVARLKEVF